MAYNPLACTLCFTPPCSAVTLPLPSYMTGSRPGSHLHPPALPGSPRHPASLHKVQAGSARGCGGGLVSHPPSFLLWPRKAARTWASAFPHQHQAGEFLPQGLFLTCACTSGSGSCLYFPFCIFFWIWTVRGNLKKPTKQPGGQKPQEGGCFKSKPTSVNHVISSAKFAWQLRLIWAAACKCLLL